MSESVAVRDVDETVPTRAELADRINEIEQEKQAEIQELRRDLHEERKQRRNVEHTLDILKQAVFDLEDVVVGESMTSVYAENNPPVVNQLEAIKRGEVDPTDVVASFEPELPIEQDVAKAMDEVMQDDLTANEERAVHIFRAFGGRSRRRSGRLIIESGDVKNILEENGETDPNPNTVKRAMKMLAKKTSDLPKSERDAFDGGNLLTLSKGRSCLELHADRSAWNEYIAEVEERVDA